MSPFATPVLCGHWRRLAHCLTFFKAMSRASQMQGHVTPSGVRPPRRSLHDTRAR